jgi:hypothetical protein
VEQLLRRRLAGLQGNKIASSDPRNVGFQLYLPDEKILSKYLRNVPDSVRQTRHLLTYVPRSPGHY